ncbi:hypothetical protein [Paenibacillus marinisediminis]
MLEWSIAAAAGAWIVVCAALTIAISSGIRLMRQLKRSVKQMDSQLSGLVQQVTEISNRGEQVLVQAQSAVEEIVKWRDTVEQTRSMVEAWNGQIGRWSERTWSAVESAQRNNEKRIYETLQWFDIGYALWQDVSARHKRNADSTQADTQRN